jgi:hypothetical protein
MPSHIHPQNDAAHIVSGILRGHLSSLAVGSFCYPSALDQPPRSEVLHHLTSSPPACRWGSKYLLDALLLVYGSRRV